MAEREGKADEELMTGTAWLVVVNVGDGAGDEEGEDEGDDVVAGRPGVDVDRVEGGEEGEAPADAVDDDALSACGELVDDGAEKEEVDEGPDAECPRGGGDVGLPARAVGGGGTGDGVDVRAEEREIRDDVHNLLRTPSVSTGLVDGALALSRSPSVHDMIFDDGGGDERGVCGEGRVWESVRSADAATVLIADPADVIPT